jgi:hypothetical protein
VSERAKTAVAYLEDTDTWRKNFETGRRGDEGHEIECGCGSDDMESCARYMIHGGGGCMASRCVSYGASVLHLPPSNMVYNTPSPALEKEWVAAPERSGGWCLQKKSS